MQAEKLLFHQRNQEIGAVLEQARLLQGRTVTECAVLLQTSRRRYTAIERGEVAISFVEMEILMRYLDIAALIATHRARTAQAESVFEAFSTQIEVIGKDESTCESSERQQVIMPARKNTSEVEETQVSQQ